MSSISVAGDTSGSITLVAPAVAGSSVLTLPVATDTLVGKATTDTLTNKTLTSPTLTSPIISGTPSGVGTLTSGTAVASTSGTSIDFTGIPSWVKRITVMLVGVSTSGTSNIQIQIGAGSATTSGYVSSVSVSTLQTSFTTGFGVSSSNAAAATIRGSYNIELVTGTTWVSSGLNSRSNDSAVTQNSGDITLGGTLDRVRITTVNGTDTFDAGSINIMYE